jgi:hypothetical protein
MNKSIIIESLAKLDIDAAKTIIEEDDENGFTPDKKHPTT